MSESHRMLTLTLDHEFIFTAGPKVQVMKLVQGPMKAQKCTTPYSIHQREGLALGIYCAAGELEN